MRQLQSDQASFLLQNLYLPGLKSEHRLTTAIIEAIPPDKGDYRPDEISKIWHWIWAGISWLQKCGSWMQYPPANLIFRHDHVRSP